MTPYRFSFETDEQYLERTQGQQTEKPSAPTKEQGATPAPALIQQGSMPSTATVFQQMATTPPGQHSSTALMVPWWLSTTLAVFVFAVFYVAVKRRSGNRPRAVTAHRKQPIGFQPPSQETTAGKPWGNGIILLLRRIPRLHIAASTGQALNRRAQRYRGWKSMGLHLDAEPEITEPATQSEELQSVALPSLPGWKITRIGSRGTN